MMNNSPFDDHIKKQFGNYKPEVPPHIWENIIARKEKRKPGGFLFTLRGNRFLLLVLLFIVTGAGALLVHNINRNETPKSISLNDKTATPPVTLNDQDNPSQNTVSESKDRTDQVTAAGNLEIAALENGFLKEELDKYRREEELKKAGE